MLDIEILVDQHVLAIAECGEVAQHTRWIDERMALRSLNRNDRP